MKFDNDRIGNEISISYFFFQENFKKNPLDFIILSLEEYERSEKLFSILTGVLRTDLWRSFSMRKMANKYLENPTPADGTENQE